MKKFFNVKKYFRFMLYEKKTIVQKKIYIILNKKIAYKKVS